MATGHTPGKSANQSPARAVSQSLEETVKVSDVACFFFYQFRDMKVSSICFNVICLLFFSFVFATQ